MFATAEVVSAKKPAKGAKKEGPRTQMDNLEEYAALCAAIEALKGQKEVFETLIKAEMGDRFVAQGCADQKKPANIEAIDGKATGNLQLKKRATTSVLTEEEQEILDDAKIPYAPHVKVQETFIINPDYATDMKLLGQVEEALKKVKGLPQNFIQKQAGDVVQVATDESLEAVFKLPAKKAAKILPLVSCLAIKATIKGDFMPVIDTIMADVETDAEAECKA